MLTINLAVKITCSHDLICVVPRDPLHVQGAPYVTSDSHCLSSHCNHQEGKTDASSSLVTVSIYSNYTLASTIELCLSTSLLTGSYAI